MKKYLIYVALIVFIGLIATLIIKNNKIENNKTVNQPISVSEASLESSTSTSEINTSSIKSEIIGTSSMSAPDKAWATFQNYLTFAKNHDLKGVSRLAHKLSSTCSEALNNPSNSAACYKILDNLYAIGKTFKKSDFPNNLFDSKQVILYSDRKETDDTEIKESSKNLLYFTVDANGDPKIIGLELGRVFTVKKSGLTEAEAMEEMTAKTKDSDNDAIEDVIETCSLKITECVETDPNKKDTDGNGYWDSTDVLLRR